MTERDPTSPAGHDAIAYRPAAAAKRLGISRSEVYLELAAGRLTARKHGTCTLIPATELDRWLNALPEWTP